jgi:hypothetical protein
MAAVDVAPTSSTLSEKEHAAGPGEGGRRDPSLRRFRLVELLFAPFRDIDEGIEAARRRTRSRDGSRHLQAIRREPTLTREDPPQ